MAAIIELPAPPPAPAGALETQLSPIGFNE